MGNDERRSRRLSSLRTRVAVFVSLSVFAGAALLFTVTVVASRSWVRSEQRSLLVDNAREHASIIEGAGLTADDLEDVLAVLRPHSMSAVDVDGRWFGAPRRVFADLIDGRSGAAVNDSIEESGVAYVADATADESFIAVPITIARGDGSGEMVSGRFYSLADHAAWDRRRERTRVIVVVSAILLAMLAAVAGAFAGRRLSRPLTDAATAARRIAAGGLTTRLPDTDDPALADLTQTFNEMAETLAARTEADRRFNSDVSHELRSPLTTVMASLAVLQSRRHELSDSNRIALELLAADLQRFARLVDDLLEISKFDGQAATLVTSRVNVNEFLEEVVKSSGRSDVNLVVSPLLRIFEIELDKRRMARVITNLIDNAFAHGSPPVWVAAIELPPGDSSPSAVKISVEDRGMGVNLDRTDELFQRFNRGPRQGRSDGSGLGLALAREHVRLHQGRITFEALPRGVNGTRIVVELPLRLPADADRLRSTLIG